MSGLRIRNSPLRGWPHSPPPRDPRMPYGVAISRSPLGGVQETLWPEFWLWNDHQTIRAWLLGERSE